MIQDIYPHIYHNEYKPVLPKPESFALYYEGDSVLAGWEQGETEESPKNLTFPRFRDLGPGAAAAAEECTYLFTIDETGYYLPALCSQNESCIHGEYSARKNKLDLWRLAQSDGRRHACGCLPLPLLRKAGVLCSRQRRSFPLRYPPDHMPKLRTVPRF